MTGNRTSEHDERRVIDRAMRSLASNAEPDRRPLPDPSFIWWKAQLMRRVDAQQEAITPITVGDRIHLAVAVIAAFGLASIVWTSLAALGPLAWAAAAGAVAALILTVGWTAWSELTGR